MRCGQMRSPREFGREPIPATDVRKMTHGRTPSIARASARDPPLPRDGCGEQPRLRAGVAICREPLDRGRGRAGHHPRQKHHEWERARSHTGPEPGLTPQRPWLSRTASDDARRHQCPAVRRQRLDEFSSTRRGRDDERAAARRGRDHERAAVRRSGNPEAAARHRRPDALTRGPGSISRAKRLNQ